MASYEVIPAAKRIDAPAGKLIEEYVGRENNSFERFSFAHMVAPPNWQESAQKPEFAELTVVVRGRLRVQVEDEVLVLTAGQAIWIKSGVRVHYGNPYSEECEYYSVCLPAFSPEQVHRDGE